MGLQMHELHLVIIESKSLITNDFIHQCNVLKQQQISTPMEDLTNSEDIGVQTSVVMV
jgi:hypothetical protein